MSEKNGPDKVDIYLIPGITFPIERTGWDGDEYWAGLLAALTAWGWQGKLLRVGFYAADTNVEIRLHEEGAPAGKNVPIKELGRRLAWRIFNDHSAQARSVAVVGHSMGGLVIRAALTGVQITEPGFPPYLDIDAVITLATPHQGNRFVPVDILGDNLQRRDLTFGSELITWLRANPQVTRLARWTVIGTVEDQYLDPPTTAVDMAAASKVMYQADQGLDHMNIHHISRGSFSYNRWTADARRWRRVPAGPSPIEMVWDALHQGTGHDHDRC